MLASKRRGKFFRGSHWHASLLQHTSTLLNLQIFDVIMKKWKSERRRLFSIFTINLFYVLLGLENLHFLRCIKRRFMDWLHQHLLHQSVTEPDQSLLIFSLFCRLLSLLMTARCLLGCTRTLKET